MAADGTGTRTARWLQRGWQGAKRAGRAAARPGRRHLLAALAVVIVAHAPYLLGSFDPDPMRFTSGLHTRGQDGLLPGQTAIDGNAGIVGQADGHRAALDWLHLHLPWWNPYEGSGNPLAGASVSGAMFVPFVLFTLAADGQVLLYLSLALIGAWATYRLLEHLGAHAWACFAAAVLFGLNGTNAWFHFAPDNPVAFLPMVLLGCERTRSSALTGRRGGWGLLTVGVAWSVLAGFPETVYAEAFVIVVWVAARTIVARRAAGRILARTALGALGGVLLAAPFAIALADFLSVGDVGVHTGTGLGHMAVPGPGAVTLFAPYALGPIVGLGKTGPGAQTMTLLWSDLGGYGTAAVLALAGAGLVGRRHRPLRLGLALVTLLLLGRAYGITPATQLVNLLPTASTVELYRYSNPAIELATIVLAALALDDALRAAAARSMAWRSGRRWQPVAGVAVVAGLGVAAVAGAAGLDRRLSGQDVGAWWWTSLLWALGTVVVVGVALASRRRRAVLAVAGLLAVESVAMFAVPDVSARRHVHLDTAVVAFVRSHLGTQRFFSFGGFAPNYGAYYGVPEADLVDLPIPRPTEAFELDQLAPDGYDTTFNGVSPGRAGPNPREELPAHLDGYRADAVGLLIFPRGESVADLPPGAATRIYRDELMDVYRLNGSLPYASAGPGCTVSVPSRTTVVTDCATPSTLVRREVMVPGWTARVGGRTVTPGSTPSGGFQTTPVPAGRAVTTYAFTPPHETLGWTACAAGVVILVAGSRRRPAWPLRRRAQVAT